MFSSEGVTLRPLSLIDRDRMYTWYLDTTTDRHGGWAKRCSREAYDLKWERLILDPPTGIIIFAIESADQCVGRIELAMIDRDNRNAAVGLFVGDRANWGQGIATKALRIVADFGFAVENLDRIYAHVYGFNERSQRLMLRAGFQAEGVMRRHELHNGELRDIHVFGLLKDEFYAVTPTLFAVPGE
jgi:RimJ/RimL family protein N-acetyltransferase